MLPQKPPEPSTGSGFLEAGFPRIQIGISIADPTNRRLVEGVSAQLGLVPIFLDEADLAHPERIAGVELLIADISCLAIPASGRSSRRSKGRNPAGGRFRTVLALPDDGELGAASVGVWASIPRTRILVIGRTLHSS